MRAEEGQQLPADGGQRLSAEDVRILALETGAVAGHTCKVIILRDALDIGELRRSVAGRLDRAPLMRMRLGEVDGTPWWVPDPQVDVTAHVVSAGLAGSGDEAGLRTAVARIFEQRLDRSRPLWRMDVIPRLANGGSALTWRIHHALADGSTAMRMAGAVLWDDLPAGQPTPGALSRPRETKPVAGPRHRVEGLRAALREAPQPWLHSPFDGHIDGRRAVAFAAAGLDELHRVARAADGATVNDAVLTVVAGGVRRWLEEHHGHLDTIRVKVPVSLHGPAAPHGGAEDPGRRGAGASPGNRDSYFCLDLPLGSADPLERLAAIRRATRLRKRGHDAQHLDTLTRELARAPKLGPFVERILAHPRSFALNVSNVPGPREPVRVLGVPVEAMYSLAEIGEHHVLRVAVVSLAGRLNFGLVADPTLLTDVDHLADAVHAEAAALTASIPLD
ncbi:MAG TPA: wax ester/triacylglycerol synthase domain-containing protein [Streptosporangiaceae bacterium]